MTLLSKRIRKCREDEIREQSGCIKTMLYKYFDNKGFTF